MCAQGDYTALSLTVISVCVHKGTIPYYHSLLYMYVCTKGLYCIITHCNIPMCAQGDYTALSLTIISANCYIRYTDITVSDNVSNTEYTILLTVISLCVWKGTILHYRSLLYPYVYRRDMIFTCPSDCSPATVLTLNIYVYIYVWRALFQNAISVIKEKKAFDTNAKLIDCIFGGKLYIYLLLCAEN